MRNEKCPACRQRAAIAEIGTESIGRRRRTLGNHIDAARQSTVGTNTNSILHPGLQTTDSQRRSSCRDGLLHSETASSVHSHRTCGISVNHPRHIHAVLRHMLHSEAVHSTRHHTHIVYKHPVPYPILRTLEHVESQPAPVHRRRPRHPHLVPLSLVPGRQRVRRHEIIVDIVIACRTVTAYHNSRSAMGEQQTCIHVRIAAHGKRRRGHHTEMARRGIASRTQHQTVIPVPMLYANHLRLRIDVVEVDLTQPARRKRTFHKSLKTFSIRKLHDITRRAERHGVVRTVVFLHARGIDCHIVVGRRRETRKGIRCRRHNTCLLIVQDDMESTTAR